MYGNKNAETTIPANESSRSPRAFTDDKLSNFLLEVKGVEINKSEKPSPKNPLGQVVPPEDGSVAIAPVGGIWYHTHVFGQQEVRPLPEIEIAESQPRFARPFGSMRPRIGLTPNGAGFIMPNGSETP